MKDNCFAFGRQHSCRALEGFSRCLGKRCSFYKTRKEFEVDRQKVNTRLAALDIEKQRDISDKYYDGNMPWLKGGADHEC